MKTFYILIATALLTTTCYAQNVGVDVVTPIQKLDVAGGLRLGNTSNGVAGSIRWNGSNFQVHNGTAWINFGTGTDLYWTLNGADIHSSGTSNVGIGTTTPSDKLQVVGTARVSSLNINGNYTLPTVDGTSGFVLSTNGSGAVTWTNPAQVGDITSVVAGAGVINGGTSGDVTIDVNPGDGLVIISDAVQVSATALEGNGLVANSNNFDVNVDNSTLDINSDVVRVKPDGITAAQIATGGVTTAEILDGTILTSDISVGAVTTSNILNGTILPADIANAGNLQVLTTTGAGVPQWQSQNSLFNAQAGDGLIPDAVNSEIDVNPGDGIEVSSDVVNVKASDLKGSGIVVNSNNFDINVDNSTVEVDIVTDKLQVKANGILSSHIAPDVIVAADIATGGVATAEILDGTILPIDVSSPGSPNLVLSTNSSSVVGWNNPATLTTVLQDGDEDTKVTVDVANADEDHIRMSTAGTERLTIEPSGEIGIGTNTPNRNLHVVNPTGGQVLVSRGDANTNAGETLGEIMFDSEDDTEPSSVGASTVIRGIASEDHGNSNKGGHLAFLTKTSTTLGTAAAIERMRITDTGNVGIGVTNPNNKLRVSSGSSSWPVRFENNNGYIEFGPANTTWAHIYSNRDFYFNTSLRAGNNNVNLSTSGGSSWVNAGNFGVGTTSPAFKLHVPSGYIGTDYINTTDNSVGAGVTGIMVKAGDNYLRTGTSSAIATFLGNYGNWIPNNGIGDWQIASSSTSTSYSNASLELRESNFSGSGGTPPHLGFHWGGVVASNISIENTGRIAIRNNPGNGYENLIANNLYASRFYDSNNTGYYADPDGVSYYNDFRMNIIYDRQNTGYYLDPASTSNTYVFYRRYGFNGVEYDINNTTYYVDPASTSIYNDMRANIFYDRANTTYYADMASGQRLNGQMEIARTTGYTYVANSQSYGYCNSCYSSAFGCCSSNWWGCTGYCYGTSCSACGTTIYSKMRVNGGIYAYAHWTLSDKKYKSDVSTIPHALNLIKQVRGVSYKLINVDNGEKSNYDENPNLGVDYVGPQIGFIAQELQKVLPQLVHEEEVETPDGGKEMQIGVAYGQMTALLVEGMKEQQKMIDELRSEIALLKNSSNGSFKSQIEMDIEQGLKLMEANKDKLEPEHRAEMIKFMDEIRDAKSLTNTQLMILDKMRKKFEAK